MGTKQRTQGPVPRKMVKFNPGLILILSNVFLSTEEHVTRANQKNEYNDIRKCCSKQCIGHRKASTQSREKF